jgi:hypothetical protein
MVMTAACGKESHATIAHGEYCASTFPLCTSQSVLTEVMVLYQSKLWKFHAGT